MDTEINQSNSIVDPKYHRKMWAGANDFVTELFREHCSGTKTVKVWQKDENGNTIKDDNGKAVYATEERSMGVDVDKIFMLCRVNNIDVDKFERQKGSHGFAGRFRMTASNMIRHAAKKRHGIYVIQDDRKIWIAAPPEWLAEKNAPSEPIENRDGVEVIDVQ